MGEFFSFIGNVLTLGMMGLILYQNEDHIEVFLFLSEGLGGDRKSETDFCFFFGQDGYFLAALIFAPFLSFSRVIACLFIPVSLLILILFVSLFFLLPSKGSSSGT